MFVSVAIISPSARTRIDRLTVPELRDSSSPATVGLEGQTFSFAEAPSSLDRMLTAGNVARHVRDGSCLTSFLSFDRLRFRPFSITEGIESCRFAAGLRARSLVSSA